MTLSLLSNSYVITSSESLRMTRWFTRLWSVHRIPENLFDTFLLIPTWNIFFETNRTSPRHNATSQNKKPREHNTHASIISRKNLCWIFSLFACLLCHHNSIALKSHHNFHFCSSERTIFIALFRLAPIFTHFLLPNHTLYYVWKGCSHHRNYRTGWILLDGIFAWKGLHGELRYKFSWWLHYVVWWCWGRAADNCNRCRQRQGRWGVSTLFFDVYMQRFWKLVRLSSSCDGAAEDGVISWLCVHWVWAYSLRLQLHPVFTYVSVAICWMRVFLVSVFSKLALASGELHDKAHTFLHNNICRSAHLVS